jgi:hypothetical protein
MKDPKRLLFLFIGVHLKRKSKNLRAHEKSWSPTWEYLLQINDKCLCGNIQFGNALLCVGHDYLRDDKMQINCTSFKYYQKNNTKSYMVIALIAVLLERLADKIVFLYSDSEFYEAVKWQGYLFTNYLQLL